jgi:ribose transport system permease protein
MTAQPQASRTSAAAALGTLALRVGRRAFAGRLTGVCAGLLGVCIYLWATQPAFMTWANWQNIFRAQAVVAILAIGMTVVVLTGGIDLAVASTTATAAVSFGLAIEHGLSWGFAAVVAISVGAAIGLVNGGLIGFGRVPFFVVTLGALAVYQSVALVLTTTGESISLGRYHSFTPVGTIVNGTVGPFPTIFLITLVLYIWAALVLTYTSFGHRIYACGANPVAARLTGINVTLITVAVYGIGGLLAGIGAVVQAGRLSAAAPQADPTLMLEVIAAVLIGGASFAGGEGNVLGTAVGVLFLGVIDNGFSLSGVSTFWQGVVSGMILIAAVTIGVLRDHTWLVRQAQLARAATRRAGRDMGARMAARQVK